MNKILVTVIATSISCLFLSASAPADTISNSKCIPDFWSSNGASLSKTTGVEKDSPAMKISAGSAKEWFVQMKKTCPLKRETAIELSFYAKADDSSQTAVQLIARGWYRGKLMSCFQEILNLEGLSNTWKKYSFYVESCYERDAFDLRFRGRGNITVSGFSFKPVKLKPFLTLQPAKVNGFAKSPIKEKLGRGFDAFKRPDGSVYLTWRLLESDAPDITFDVFAKSGGKYRKLNQQPIRQTTDFVVSNPPAGVSYCVRPSIGFKGAEGNSELIEADRNGASGRHYKLSKLEKIHRIVPCDLDGDGEYDYVAYGGPWIDPGWNLWKASPRTLKLEAFRRNGEKLWTYDFGFNIESGVWYSPWTACDLNGDGRAEVILKGSLPEDGDFRNYEGAWKGQVNGGPEYLLVLDGLTGKVIAKAPWIPRRELLHRLEYSYSYCSRNQLCVAYLDGKTPCILMLRGTYNFMIVQAWQFHDGKLKKLWTYTNRKLDRAFWGQGGHTTRCVDVDGDGRDEVVLGGAVIDDNGTPLWSTGLGHPDFVFVGDIMPEHPGMEILTMYETRHPKGGGFTCCDAKSGKVLWSFDKGTWHIHRGFAGDIDARYRGWESGGTDSTTVTDHLHKLAYYYFSPSGKLLFTGTSANDGKTPFARTIPYFAYWDGDLQREIIGKRMRDYRGGYISAPMNGKFVTAFDTEGDWREELVFSYKGGFSVYSTTIPAMDRRVCLMQDHLYRMCVIAHAQGYTYDNMYGHLPTSESPNLNLTVLHDRENVLEVTVSAPLRKALRGHLKLKAPKGTTLKQSDFKIDLAPGKLKTFEVEFSKPEKFGLISAELKLDDNVLLKVSVPVSDPPLPNSNLPSAGIVIEAENLVSQSGGQVMVRDDKSGISDRCFSHWDSSGHKIVWKTKIDKPGRYSLLLRYAAAGTAVRQLIVNGRDLGSCNFAATGGVGNDSGTWAVRAFLDSSRKVLVLDLPAGETTIELINKGGSMNLDYLWLFPVKKKL